MTNRLGAVFPIANAPFLRLGLVDTCRQGEKSREILVFETK